MGQFAWVPEWNINRIQMQGRKKEIGEYLATQVNIFVQPMVYEIAKKRPADPAFYAMNWLRDYIANSRPAETKLNNIEVCSDSESDDIEVPFDEVKFNKKKQQQGKKHSRMAISEEVFGNFNRKESFIPKVVEKSEQAKVLILSLLRNSILFKSLDCKDEEVLINAMKEKQTAEGEVIIKEGDDGDHLFIVNAGEYACSKTIKGTETFVKSYGNGDSFGELALLYNAPRAATITCSKPGLLYVLDRQTFSHIVKNAANKKRESHLGVLGKIEIFSELSSIQKEQFIDVLKEEKYEPGQYIIRQGEVGDKFYIIIDGKLAAQKVIEQNENPRIVYNYKEGDYFGELSLIHDSNRQASVKCLTSVRVAYVARDSFKRILGSLEDILKRNEGRYKLFQQKTNS